jgi:hypothetical protein
MRVRTLILGLAFASAMTLVSRASAQTPPQEPENPAPTAPPPTNGGSEVSQRGTPGRVRPVFGKLSAIQSDSIEVTGQDGAKVAIKITSRTEFRKDRLPAKIGDFKLGDMVVVRTDSESGKPAGATATIVASGSPGMMTRGGAGGPSGMPGTMGKDFVVGEVKSVDPPKLVVLRVDHVTQTLELTEETSLRRARDSITMAEIQPGDHIFARGTSANDVFVPKTVNVISPDQWKQMEEMNARDRQGGASTPNAQSPSEQKPPEQPN